MYDITMASLTTKTIKGKTYYYARECRRVHGKPKIVWQHYLGKADDIIARCTGAGPQVGTSPSHAVLTEFGAIAALYDLARRLNLVDLIDDHAPKRGPGPSVGTYLLIAALNRCVAPGSKVSIGPWFGRTILRRLLDVESRQLTSQRFWDNMDRVSSTAIEAIEGELAQRVVRTFDLDLRRLLFDATNFFTFLDTFNERCHLARRGKSKEGRTSLRVVGLALLVTADFQIPLFHRVYPGNQTDAPTFGGLIQNLVQRYRQIAQGTEHVTLIFDKGNNSSANLEAVEQSPYHFIGSLVPTQHPDLLAIPASRFHSLAPDGLSGVRAYRTSRSVFGVERTVLVTYNENLFVAQSRTLLREIGKRQEKLHTLQQQLLRRQRGTVRGGQPPTPASLQKQVDVLLAARHMKELFHVEIGRKKDLPNLGYRFDRSAWQHLQRTLLGKTILFTDNADWGDAEIVRGYRSQYHVEGAFRQIKDPACITIRPQFHWTDQKIEVHVFSCVLALLLCSLLQRELHRQGLDHSLRKILELLQDIREVSVIYPGSGTRAKPCIHNTLSAMSPEQRRLFDTLNLHQYLTA
jgi:transposase